jgi:hypothetical protein
MWVEFEVLADGLEDVPAWSENLVWELRTRNKLVHSLDN